MSEITDLLERFRRGPELIAAVLTGAAGSELDYAPAPGKWNIRQVLAHVADSEIVGADRFRRIIAEDNPVLQAYDQDAWARNLNYAGRKTSESLETFRRLRAENYELLKGLSPQVFNRQGNHTERGPQTLLQILETYAMHAENHARQLQSIRQQFKQSKAGAAR